MQNCMPKGGYKGKNPFAVKSNQMKGTARSGGYKRPSMPRSTGQRMSKKKM